jgi:hypothetical protein
MRRVLTDGDFGTEFWQQLATYRHTAWRWENQPVYTITDERANFEAFLAGHPADPMEDPYLSPWMRQVAEQTAGGRRIGRVRVVEEPPTEYQRWELWLDRWNTAAGERIDYLTRSRADALGTTPFGDCDWWLFDDERLMVMHFDAAGRRVHVELSNEERDLAPARRWRGRVLDVASRLALETSRRAA